MTFWAIYENVPILVKTVVKTFLGTFCKNWATYHFTIWSHWLPLLL